MANETYKFPDEVADAQIDTSEHEETDDKLIIEVEDDTPVEDRGVRPLPKEIVESLDKDDLSSYGKKVKARLSEMRKVWHDERRAKDDAVLKN